MTDRSQYMQHTASSDASTSDQGIVTGNVRQIYVRALKQKHRIKNSNIWHKGKYHICIFDSSRLIFYYLD